MNQFLSEFVRDHTSATRVPPPAPSARFEPWSVDFAALRDATSQVARPTLLLR